MSLLVSDEVATEIKRRRKHPTERKSTILTIILWAMVAYFLLPLLWLMIASTKDNDDLFTTFGLWFGTRMNLFENLVDVFTTSDGIYLRWAANTLLYAVVSALGASFLPARSVRG